MFNPLGFISKFIKSTNQRELDRISKIVRKINTLEEKFQKCHQKLLTFSQRWNKCWFWRAIRVL